MDQKVMTKQTTSSVLMVRPVLFGYNPQTAASNAFQHAPATQEAAQIQAKALAEFDGMVATLRQAGIQVVVVEDGLEPHTPDSIFPNNWVTFHQDGQVVLYPMYAPNRRLERKQAVLDQIAAQFEISTTLDLSTYEKQGQFVEGTGSMILDRTNRLIYACFSPRTDKRLLEVIAQQLGGYQVVSFQALDQQRKPIYHTNVMMCLADEFAVICLDCLPDPKEREMVCKSLQKTGKTIVEITFDQVLRFAGNMLALESTDGQKWVILSKQAYEALTSDQINQISRFAKLLPCAIDIIEHYGGGSARCMMAEIFLPTKAIIP